MSFGDVTWVWRSERHLTYGAALQEHLGRSPLDRTIAPKHQWKIWKGRLHLLLTIENERWLDLWPGDLGFFPNSQFVVAGLMTFVGPGSLFTVGVHFVVHLAGPISYVDYSSRAQPFFIPISTCLPMHRQHDWKRTSLRWRRKLYPSHDGSWVNLSFAVWFRDRRRTYSRWEAEFSSMILLIPSRN